MNMKQEQVARLVPASCSSPQAIHPFGSKVVVLLALVNDRLILIS